MQHQIVVREALGFPGRVEGILGDFLAVHVDVHMFALGRVVRPGVIRQPALDTAALIVVGAGAFAVKFRARLETEMCIRDRFFTRAPLKEDDILDTYQQLLAAQLNHTGSMLSVDDTSFVKKGTHSIGVKRQYCGRLGKRENCQVGVFLSYAGDSGYGLVDYELYIPQEWFQDSHQDLRTSCLLYTSRCV